MEFRQLKTFRVLADTLNFTRTAEKLFMAQSSVSAQIKALESDLGVKLFDRIGRTVMLTQAGIKLDDYARKMVEMTHEIQSEISDNQYTKGRLTIRVPETIATVFMPDIIEEFSRINPKVQLTFINCSDRQLKEELNTGRIDLAFLMTDAIHFKDVTVDYLRPLDLALVAGPEHPLADKKNVTFSDLADHRLFLPRTD